MRAAAVLRVRGEARSSGAKRQSGRAGAAGGPRNRDQGIEGRAARRWRYDFHSSRGRCDRARNHCAGPSCIEIPGEGRRGWRSVGAGQANEVEKRLRD